MTYSPNPFRLPLILSFVFCVLISITTGLTGTVQAAPEKPNIVIIYGDDMGIDSVGAFNEKLGLDTPHLNRLASEGMSFMDAHSTSGVCTPSRYSLLTGRYHWRSRLKSGIVGKWERPLIEEKRLTLPGMLKEHGYSTRMIGKWHLGHHWPKKGGGITAKESEIDFKGSIKGGPNAIGFDYWFGDDVPNWPPYAWRENDKLLGEITTTSKEIGLTAYTGVGNGPSVADWKLEDVLPEYAKRCASFIREQKEAEKPFFLYFPMPSPHTPIVPNAEWKGKSGISDYADFLLETDWAVGEVLNALDESNQTKNTLVIFTTDNGTSPKANFEELESHGVHLRENWRGNKADAFEGGHRVPFIVRWPDHIAAGSRNDEIITQADILATIAELVGHAIPENAAEDSLSILPILSGEKSDAPLHEAVVNHSISGHFVLRQGKWKLLFCQGSGGWSAPREPEAAKQGLPHYQLYDLEADPKETNNVHDQHPEVVSGMSALLRRYIEEGRSTPGSRQPNHDNAIHWRNVPWEKAASKPTAPLEAKVEITTPKGEQMAMHRDVAFQNAPTDGQLSLPTPFPNIIRAWSGSPKKPEFHNWSFNNDATEIHVHLNKNTDGAIKLLTAETSEVQPDGTIVFSALDAKVVGEKAKLETHPGNHRIGFWARGEDFVTWNIDGELKAGSYDVELVYSRSGKPGAKAEVTIGEASLPVNLKPTGSWYVYQVQPIGSVELSESATLKAHVKSTVQLGAVMNLKAILLHPK